MDYFHNGLLYILSWTYVIYSTKIYVFTLFQNKTLQKTTNLFEYSKRFPNGALSKKKHCIIDYFSDF